MDLPVLNLPGADFRVKETAGLQQIFDSVRKRFVALTPEEWVRQHFIQFMVNSKKYPASLLGVEMKINVNNLNQRADIVVYNREGKPWMIVECKSPSVQLTETVFYQAARYNLPLKVTYFVVTNGLEHYCLFFNGTSFEYLDDLPDFTD